MVLLHPHDNALFVCPTEPDPTDPRIGLNAAVLRSYWGGHAARETAQHRGKVGRTEGKCSQQHMPHAEHGNRLQVAENQASASTYHSAFALRGFVQLA